MSSTRDNPCNRSTRPLLDRKHPQPQLLLKKKYDYKVCGFNDFQFVSKQCNNSTYYTGYPYGSPPSPTIASATTTTTNFHPHSDFIFSDDSGINLNNSSCLTNASATINNYNHFYTSSINVADDDDEDDDDQHSTSRGPFIFGMDPRSVATSTIPDRYQTSGQIAVIQQHSRLNDHFNYEDIDDEGRLGSVIKQTTKKTQYSEERNQVTKIVFC